MNKTNAAQLLLAAASVLPALAQAGTQPLNSQLSYRFSQYREDDINTLEPIAGVKQRYQIDVHQFRVLTPIAQAFALDFSAVNETLSGASPRGTQLNANGQLDLVMSGASISEKRRDVAARVNWYGEHLSVGAQIGQSDENDYHARYNGLDISLDLDQRNTTLQLGFSQSDDELAPTDAELFDRVLAAEKSSKGLFLSWTQVISSTTLAQFSISQTQHDGFLSDPYKSNDQRPASRTQQTASVKLRQFIPYFNAALHADYRYYQDDWEVISHTIELGWYQNIGERWHITPAMRYYAQSQASFYTPYYEQANTSPYYATDYRLSPYGAISRSLTLAHDLDKWSWSLRYERYQSDANYAMDTVIVANPALVSFTMVTLGIDWRF